MKIAYLIDKDSVGGGMEYIRRQIAAHPHDECRVFASVRGECTAGRMNAWGADVVHANHLKALVQLFRNPFTKPRGKVVFTVHGIHLRKYDFLPKTLPNRIKRFLRLSLERRLYRKCDELIALTETDAADIRRLYGTDLPVRVEPNAVDADELAQTAASLRYPSEAFAFACIARFDFQKGQDILLQAIALAQDKLRAYGRRTLLIGGGPTLEDMKDLADTSGISDIVEFAGETVLQFFQFAQCVPPLDIFGQGRIHPQRHADPLPLVTNLDLGGNSPGILSSFFDSSQKAAPPFSCK